MSKIGRPKQDDANTRSKVLRVRLTEAERIEMIERSASAGYPTLSDFVRDCALRRALPARRLAGPDGVFSPADRKALVNLGNNLNQIARAKNSGRPNVMEDELTRAIEKLDELFDRYLPK